MICSVTALYFAPFAEGNINEREHMHPQAPINVIQIIVVGNGNAGLDSTSSTELLELVLVCPKRVKETSGGGTNTSATTLFLLILLSCSSHWFRIFSCVMDRHSSSSHTYHQENEDEISFLLNTSSSYSMQTLPLTSSRFLSSASGEDAVARNDSGAAGSLKADQCSLLHVRRRSLDQELDSFDCASEEGLEEPAKLAPARTCSLKRNRAAEVHNLSEKRRRSRINEKLKALQSLIPNSRKTDKASMLDEAIEYLKQLQLQVQMLSMRNNLGQRPMYLSGALQIGINFGLGTDREMNSGAGTLPLNQGSSVPISFLSASFHQSTSLPSVIDFTKAAISIAMEPSQSHHVSIEEILTRDMIPHQQLDARHSLKNLTENEVISMADATQRSRGQASSLVGADSTEECMLGRER